MPGKKRNWKCVGQGCTEVFATITSRTDHIKSVHMPCPVKGCRTWIKRSEGALHIKNNHKNINGSCRNCGKKMYLTSLLKHVETCPGSDTLYQCSAIDCGAIFLSLKALRDHMKRVHVSRVPCLHPGCNRMVKQASMFLHVKKQHESVVDTSPCGYCGLVLPAKYMTSHQKACFENEKNAGFQCSLEGCTKIFTTKQERDQHLDNEHESPCPFAGCDRIFKKPSWLQMHIRQKHL